MFSSMRNESYIFSMMCQRGSQEHDDESCYELHPEGSSGSLQRSGCQKLWAYSIDQLSHICCQNRTYALCYYVKRNLQKENYRQRKFKILKSIKGLILITREDERMPVITTWHSPIKEVCSFRRPHIRKTYPVLMMWWLPIHGLAVTTVSFLGQDQQHNSSNDKPNPNYRATTQ